MSSSIGKAAGGELDKAGLVFPNSGNPVEKQSIAEERDFRLSDGHPPQYVEFEERNGHREEQSRSLSRGRGKDFPKHWKPITLRAPILGGFIIISLSIIATLEVLSCMSSKNGGGLAFAADGNSLPMATTFGYLYFPTILAVSYSMVWSWVDLDAKRLEPWLQLSKACGASADDSLLLQYPFDFLPFIPVTALRRKHFGVFLAGTVMLMVFWVITPLQSAIFNPGIVTRIIPTNFITTASLFPVESQTDELNANFLNIGYAVSWLNQKLPEFTTFKYAVLPFQPAFPAQGSSPSQTWTTNVDAFSTRLFCSPANISLSGLYYTFSNGKGCSVPEIALADTLGQGDYMLNYIGYHDNAEVDWALQNTNCSQAFSNNFLAIWASNSSRIASGVYADLTALFCETNYNVQKMSVTVNATGHGVVSGTPISGLGNRTNVESVEEIFNTTAFEYVLSTGVNPSGLRSNLPDTAVLEQYPRLMNYGLAWPMSNMVGFAVALSGVPIQDLVTPTALQSAFESAHQLLFTTAFSTLSISTEPESQTQQSVRPGTLQDSPGAIILVRTIAVIVEVALGVVALLTSFLWYHCHMRPSNLKGDPASIADIMYLVHDGDVLCIDMKDVGSLPEASLRDSLSNQKFRVIESGNQIVHLSSVDAGQRENSATFTTSTTTHLSEKFQVVRPIELRLTTGSCFITVIVTSLALLVFMNVWSSKLNGLPLPSNNSVILSMIENYLPTAFATFLEPVWVILNRLLCLLKPFEQLRMGNAKPTTSVQARYTSLPPQLVFWRALQSRHFLLAAVCIASVLTNLLAVTLSTLLNQNPTIVALNAVTSQDLTPQFNGTRIRADGVNSPAISYSDHFYVAMSNLTQNTTLPPWIDHRSFYLPFDLEAPAKASNSIGSITIQGFRGATTGFSAEATCSRLSSGQGDDNFQFQASGDGLTANFSTSHLLPNGTVITCYPSTLIAEINAANQGFKTTGFPISFPSGPVALEVMQTMYPADGIDDEGFCASLIVAGWVRAVATITSGSGTANATTSLDGDLSFTFLECRQKVQVAQFDVFVDPSGQIMDSNETSKYLDEQSLYLGNSSESSLLQESNSLIAPFHIGGFTWHNDSFTSDWMNALLGMVLNSAELVDPSVPAPDASKIAPLVEGLYEQLFAALLALNTHVFSETQKYATMPAQAIVVETRIFVSPIMFKLSVIVLSIHLIVAITYYTRRPKPFLPRMPTTIASIIGYVSASRALEDFQNKNGPPSDARYGYGRFIGTDGKSHVGIERQRYVIPLKSQNPDVKRRKWGLRRRKENESQPRNWI